MMSGWVTIGVVSSHNIKCCTMVTQGTVSPYTLGIQINESLFADDGFNWLQDVELEHPSNGGT